MRKELLILLLGVVCTCYSADWQNDWTGASIVGRFGFAPYQMILVKLQQEGASIRITNNMSHPLDVYLDEVLLFSNALPYNTTQWSHTLTQVRIPFGIIH